MYYKLCVKSTSNVQQKSVLLFLLLLKCHNINYTFYDWNNKNRIQYSCSHGLVQQHHTPLKSYNQFARPKQKPSKAHDMKISGWLGTIYSIYMLVCWSIVAAARKHIFLYGNVIAHKSSTIYIITTSFFIKRAQLWHIKN